jgi:SAM-dependent methyltransferase
MELGFGGELPDLYDTYRHGYPPAVIDAVADAFGLTARDIAVDLGCGTGQLALPLAGRVRAVLGVDPEPDMIARARRNATERGLANVSWMVGADTDLPALTALLGERSVAAVTVGQALHWMDHEELFAAVARLARAGGGVAVITNGTPLWLQDSDWSRALRGCLERWVGTELRATCGTDEASQGRYADALSAAGLEVSAASVEYTAQLSLDQVVGAVYSAGLLPAPDQRPDLAGQVRAALAPATAVAEPVRVAMLFGRVG